MTSWPHWIVLPVVSALLLAIALRTRAETGSDHVDGEEPR